MGYSRAGAGGSDPEIVGTYMRIPGTDFWMIVVAPLYMCLIDDVGGERLSGGKKFRVLANGMPSS